MNRKKEILDLVRRPVETFEHILSVSVVVNAKILDECLCKVEDTIDKEFEQKKGVDQYKYAGVTCYWIRKLKPFRLLDEKNRAAMWANEIIAFLLAYSLVLGYSRRKGVFPKLSARAKQYSHKPKIKAIFFGDLIAYLRYGNMSPHSLIMFFKALSI